LAFGHPEPTTLVALDIGSATVSAELHVPLSELGLAFGHDVWRDPQRRIREWDPAFRTYLTEHIRPVTAAGQPWRVDVESLRVSESERSASGPAPEVLVGLLLTPPAGADVRHLVLHFDLILHQVVTHKAVVSVRSDWQAGQVEPMQLGVIAVDTGSSKIEPFVVSLGEGSWRAGFQRMIALGMEHIREGTDHLLFLLVLLLPATLTASGGRWMGFAGVNASLVRLFKIVTAFTVGHSVTLLAGALQWLRLPQQPVEVLIAGSILLTAVHAVRPIFPEREAQVAAGFGLVHGLAFATVLAQLPLTSGAMALSILGFNLGIELMQVYVVAMTVPWFLLLSQTPVYGWFRVAGAVFAAIAALGWIVNRVSGKPNAVEQTLAAAAEFAPLAILLLAGLAITSWLWTFCKSESSGSFDREEANYEK